MPLPTPEPPHPRRRSPRRSRLALLAGVISLTVLVSGCGAGQRTPSVNGLPMVPGSHVVVSQKVCDAGANAYCGIQMVVRNGSYPNGRALALAEKALLKARRWKKVDAPIGLEWAADSPGDRLSVEYAGAPGELQAIDLGLVKRTRRITVTLSREIFDHHAAMALDLELGTTS